MKSGFVAILGKPNVGKSSLMNRLVGEKVSIVSPKSQTTRDRILGILTTGNYQMIFIDTPGALVPKNLLGRHMDKAAKGASADADAILFVLDATKRLLSEDKAMIEKTLAHKNGPPVYIAINKIDLAGFEQTYPVLSALSPLLTATNERRAVKELIPVSARTGENVEKLKEFLIRELPDGEMFFPEDDLTDRTIRFQIAETIREKALIFLRDEIPHGIGVVVQTMSEGETLAEIEADIILEKESHKPIVIGAGGEQLKQIGENARRDIEKMLDKKVFLKLFVKVRADWRNRKNILNDILE